MDGKILQDSIEETEEQHKEIIHGIIQGGCEMEVIIIIGAILYAAFIMSLMRAAGRADERIRENEHNGCFNVRH